MNKKDVERLKEIILCANELNWLKEPQRGPDSYPTKQLSEVEKCMLAMTDDIELERLKRWVSESKTLSEMYKIHSDKFGEHFQDIRNELKNPTFIIPKEPPPKSSFDCLTKSGDKDASK